MVQASEELRLRQVHQVRLLHHLVVIFSAEDSTSISPFPTVAAMKAARLLSTSLPRK
jgi:hypothetical protein